MKGVHFAVGATGIIGLCWGMAWLLTGVTAWLGTPGIFFVLLTAVLGFIHGASK